MSGTGDAVRAARTLGAGALAVWRCLALVGGVLAVAPVRGWPGRSTPCGTASACTTLLAAVIFEIWLCWYRMAWHSTSDRKTMASINFVLALFHVLKLCAVVRRRRALVDVLECLRLYGARLPLGVRGAAATLALASVVPAHMAVFVTNSAIFRSVFVGQLGSAKATVFLVTYVLEKLQWSVAFVLMLYPMVVVGSLSADLRRGCSRTMALRLRQQSSWPGPHESIVLVVLCTLVSPSMYLAGSLMEMSRPNPSKKALIEGIIGILYILNLAVFSFFCVWFFSESGALKEDLQGFLVKAKSLERKEAGEVSMFINQIDRQHMFSIWGTLDIDKKFTVAIILAATTHVAVLIQMDKPAIG
ncbi:Elongation factor 4 [Frankliniella fusca]|uniref:Elongation factor 4 n=1 Tax=Frankliniella fusca TaxID=407009 RepID=A0AAE1LDY1_9NEOP|nr:Elongation factor 4 [Frankliniella fusca]